MARTSNCPMLGSFLKELTTAVSDHIKENPAR
jgi:hypothetical protein